MKKRYGITILLIIILCLGLSGCDMLNDILSNTPRDRAAAEENGTLADEEPAAPAAEPEEEEDLSFDSPWWGTFAADGSNYTISHVSDMSFRFVYVNLYAEEELRGTADFKGSEAVYINVNFRLEGDVLTVSWWEHEEDKYEYEQKSLEFWRAFDYLEISPLPLEEDEGMIPQDKAMKGLEAIFKSQLEAGMFLNPAGAVEIAGQPCWTFSVGHNFDHSFAGGTNFAAARDGTVYVRNDYLLQYVIQPYVSIDVEQYLEKGEQETSGP